MALNRVFALEAIQYQNGMFFKELTMAFEEARKNGKEKYLSTETAEYFQKIVHSYTNLNIQFKGDGASGPCIYIPDLNKNHPLLGPMAKAFYTGDEAITAMIQKGRVFLEGSVDLVKGTATGDYTIFTPEIYMPYVFVEDTRFSPEELAAILLHEVGHFFTFLEWMARTTTTNFALLDIANRYRNKPTIDVRKTILVEARNFTKLDIDVNKLSEIENADIVSTAILSTAMNKSESEIGSNVYDVNNFEFLADQYAQRQGAGRYLITGLDKLFKSSIFAKINRGSLVMSILSLLALTVIAMQTSVIVAIILAVSSKLIGDVLEDNEALYDRPFNRLRRMRFQMVESLKDKNTTPGQANQIRADIEYVDTTIQFGEDREGIVKTLISKLSPVGRRRFSQEKLQRELETLGSNDLFLKAYDLKTL